MARGRQVSSGPGGGGRIPAEMPPSLRGRASVQRGGEKERQKRAEGAVGKSPGSSVGASAVCADKATSIDRGCASVLGSPLQVPHTRA